MRATDLKATVYPVIVALAVASALGPTVMGLGLTGHRGAAVTIVAPGHRLAAGIGPDNNPWD
jgi:hypothetical protein